MHQKNLQSDINFNDSIDDQEKDLGPVRTRNQDTRTSTDQEPAGHKDWDTKTQGLRTSRDQEPGLAQPSNRNRDQEFSGHKHQGPKKAGTGT